MVYFKKVGVFMYKVFQIKLAKEVTNYVNSNDRGHLGGEEKYPEYKAHMAVMRGAEGFTGDMFEHYKNVCNVAKDGGLVSGDEPFKVDNLEEVFKILNGYYFDEDANNEEGEDIVFDNHVSGYKMKTFERDGKTHEYRDMHSLSVGDIVHDVDNDTYNIVDSFGYKDVTAEIIANISGEVLNEVS
tara:strand:- start:10511 stop:11065 length:555 start_codon:yes stop_codon:yes gene_type:complete